MPLPIFVSRNGELILPAQASISVFNPAIYGAFGVYESLQVQHGVVFAQQEHLKRLARSAAILKLPLPANPMILDRWIADVLRANGARDCTLRVFIIGPEAGTDAITFIWPQPPPHFPRSYYAEGVPVVSFEGTRLLPQAKSLNTLISFLARRAAQEAGAHEALLYQDGCLTEGSNSNLFAVIAGEVVTPPADEVLAGVTRDLLIGLAREHGLTIREAALPLAEARHWDECFITSTSRHVMPVTQLDGRPVGNGSVGALTQRLSAAFETWFEAQCPAVASDHRQL